MPRASLLSRGGRPFETKRDLAIERLREAILRGEYEPGERLLQNEVAKRFGLSATPIREALTQLEAQGLVVHESHRGVRVVGFNVSDVEEVYAVRGLLEGYATQLAIANLTPAGLRKLENLHARMENALKGRDLRSLRGADTEFHMTLYKAAKITRLVNLIRQQWATFPRHALWLIPRRANKSVAEHRMILAAIKKGDAEGAAREVRRNLESGRGDLLEFIRSGNAPPLFNQNEEKGLTRVG